MSFRRPAPPRPAEFPPFPPNIPPEFRRNSGGNFSRVRNCFFPPPAIFLIFFYSTVSANWRKRRGGCGITFFRHPPFYSAGISRNAKKLFFCVLIGGLVKKQNRALRARFPLQITDRQNFYTKTRPKIFFALRASVYNKICFKSVFPNQIKVHSCFKAKK